MSQFSPETTLLCSPIVAIRKLLKPQKTIPTTCLIYAKCEYRNPSGSIWDRLVFHEMKRQSGKTHAFVTGGIDDLCLSLAWCSVVSSAAITNGDTISASVLPGTKFDETKLQLLHGFGANVVLSYQQDLDRENTQNCLESHIQNLETTSGVAHHKILPYSIENQTNAQSSPYDSLVEEIAKENTSWNVFVCSGQDQRLLQALKSKFCIPDVTIIAIDFSENRFTETVETNEGKMEGVQWVQISDAECYDMARRLVREEGLLVGPVSGGVMAAAIKHAALNSTSLTNILAILPDSLQNNSKDFLSVDWMVQKGFYSPLHLESIFWWYEMALENMNPPQVLIVTPETPTKCVYSAMNNSATDRCVVVTAVSAEEKRVVGVVTRESLASSQDQNVPVGEVCTRHFGLIDSKANFSELEQLLRKYNWIVNMHHMPIFTGATKSELQIQTNEDILGVINMADFIKYKRKIERHHLTEFGLAMSDGIASDVWLERFNEHIMSSST